MSWIGKLIGGTVGFVMGGPLGLVAGAAFGHLFDASNEQTQDQNSNSRDSFSRQSQQNPFFFTGGGNTAFSAQQQSQMIFFVGAFSMLAKISLADGSVTQAERQRVQAFIDSDLKLDQQSRLAAMRIYETALVSQGTFDQFAIQFYENFKHEQEFLDLLIDIFYQVAVADGSLSAAEETLIRRAGNIFHFSEARMESIRKRSSKSPSSDKSYAVLGVSPQATDDEVKKAYRHLVSEYHPDKIAAKGLPEEFITFANEKFREIQEAYEAIKSSRNL